MHNTESNTDPTVNSTDWAKRFVPLPPTNFPDETPTYAVSNTEGMAMDSGNISEYPEAQADFPCLQEIAGIDPFFNPPAPTDSSSFKFVAATTPLYSSSTPLPLANNAEQTKNEQDGAGFAAAVAPPVEIIGQQLEQALGGPEETPVVESPSLEAEPTDSLMNHSNSENPISVKPIVELHEYDLAMKVLPNTDAVEIKGENPSGQTGDANDGESVSATADYWGVNNVSCFIPGITPIEAYPVCQEFVEQVAFSATAASITPDDTSSQLESSVGSLGQTEANTETSRAGQQANGSEDSGAVAEVSLEPTQIDPFASDEFEAVYHVPLMRPENQNLQAVPTSQPDTIDRAEAGFAHEADPVASDETDSQIVSEEVQEPVAADATGAIATPTTEPAASQLAAPPLDVTQAIPKLPSSHISIQSSGSHKLFESVEQSLSDLQTVNEMDSEATFSPAEIEVQAETESHSETESRSESELECQVVQVDGLDGYDFLDLKAFDVKDAMFCPGKIFLNAETAKFQIEYKNLNLAVFANDFQVELK